tara:strand:+ start:1146 stop:2234 length:1089 start_codon:yes stop_codon:yes gene_type:complete
MKALIVAGGTGGHIYPALEVARIFNDSEVEIHWIGEEQSLEKEICDHEGFNFYKIKSKGFRNKSFIKKLISLILLLFSLVHSFLLLIRIKPDFVFCCGGYITLGPGLSSAFLRIPLFIHEQNSIPGTANKFLSYFSENVFEGFPSAFKESCKAIYVGNPVRREIITSQYKKSNTKKSKEFNLLILGGSQGSQQLNSIVMTALSQIDDTPDWKITHQTGREDEERLQDFYSDLNFKSLVVPFINDMGSAYSNADLVISRAGAMTIAELAASNKASILLPLPWATDNHQYYNAMYLKNHGAAEVLVTDISSTRNDSTKLFNILLDLSTNTKKRLSMADSAKLCSVPEVTDKIYKTVYESIKKIS